MLASASTQASVCLQQRERPHPRHPFREALAHPHPVAPKPWPSKSILPSAPENLRQAGIRGTRRAGGLWQLTGPSSPPSSSQDCTHFRAPWLHNAPLLAKSPLSHTAFFHQKEAPAGGLLIYRVLRRPTPSKFYFWSSGWARLGLNSSTVSLPQGWGWACRVMGLMHIN